MSNKSVYHLSNSYIVLFIIGYYAIGSYIFSNYYVTYDYINKFINIFFNQNLNLIFILPSFILMTSYIYKNLNNTSIITRFKTRKEYLRYLLKSIVKVNTILYILILIITFIMCNLTSYQDLVIIDFNYSNNLIMMLLGIIKMWVWLILFSFIVIGFYIIVSKSNIANLLSLILVCAIYFSKYIIGIVPSLAFLNPYVYIMDNNEIFSSLLFNNISSGIYYIIILIIVLFVLNFAINKKEFYMEGGRD